MTDSATTETKEQRAKRLIGEVVVEEETQPAAWVDPYVLQRLDENLSGVIYSRQGRGARQALYTKPQAREDAPAEAGELEWKVDYNAVVAVSAYLQKQGLLDSAKAVERMLSRAAAYRNCRDAHAELAALRAQPQAREDAQPVGWNGRGKCDCWDDTGLCPRCFPDVPEHPAPDALRVAVAALEAAKTLAMKHAPLSIAPKIIKAIAALKGT